MIYFLFYTLCLVCLAGFIEALRSKEGIFQFPFLFAASFLFSLIPQTVSFVFFSERLPPAVAEDYGVELALLMCILCFLAGWLGYRRPLVQSSTVRKPLPVLSHEKMFYAGVALYAIAFYGMWSLAQLAGGFKTQFMGGGHYALTWSGAPVIYAYLIKLMYPALMLCVLSAMHRGSLYKWSIIALFLLYPLATTVFLGRRSGTFYLAVTVAMCLWFQKRVAVPRLLAVAGCLLVGALIILMPEYRGNVNKTGNVRESVESVEVREAINNYLRGERGEGFENFVLGAGARLHSGSFSFGLGFWNALIEDLVPAQLVGADLKKLIMPTGAASDAELFPERYGTSPERGSVDTGPYSVYSQFFLFGCVFYYFMARAYRRLWWHAEEKGNLQAQIWYTATVILIPVSVINSCMVASAALVYSALFLVPITALIRETTIKRRARPASARKSEGKDV